MPPPTRNVQRALELETRALLAKADLAFAGRSCPATAECCQLAKTGRPPWLYPGEWWLVLQVLRQEGRALPPPRADGACPFLDASGRRCTVYQARPLGCRTYFCDRARGSAGASVEVMNELLERLHAAHVAREVEAAPRPLPDWHRSDGGQATLAP